jgi:drug/metabolite transporter (DMT)-like permease
MGRMARGQAEEKLRDEQAPLKFGLTALILSNLCLSLGPIFVREADTGPVASGFWRIALATPVLFLIARAVGDPARRLTRPMVGLFLLSGAIFAADLAAWHLGVLQTKLANSNLLGNSTSFLLPLYIFVATRTMPTRFQALALGLAAIGAGFLLGGSFELSPRNFVGDLLCILAGAFYTVYILLMARARASMGQWPVLAWTTAMTAAPLLVMAFFMNEKIWPTDWTPLVALAFSSQVAGQGLMIYVIGRVSPVLFGITLLMQPMISAVIGWFAYDERLTAIDGFGALLIGLAMLLVREESTRS